MTADGGSEAGSDELVPLSGVPGVTDEEIAFAVLGTGAASSPIGGCQLTCYVAGIEAYFDYRNSEGGVHGRQLVIGRSEEHTSELQSLMRISYAVFCLKKKKEKENIQT